MNKENSFVYTGGREAAKTLGVAAGIVGGIGETLWQRTKETRSLIFKEMLHALRREKRLFRYGRYAH